MPLDCLRETVAKSPAYASGTRMLARTRMLAMVLSLQFAASATAESTAGPEIDVCDPNSNNICECYSIATRTTPCRLFGTVTIDPDCRFAFRDSDELGLRCSVVWSTKDQRCGFAHHPDYDKRCKDLSQQNFCDNDALCIWNKKEMCGRWPDRCGECLGRRTHQTWSREELESAAAFECRSGGRKLDANMISSTVCLTRDGYWAKDCLHIGCLR